MEEADLEADRLLEKAREYRHLAGRQGDASEIIHVWAPFGHLAGPSRADRLKAARVARPLAQTLQQLKVGALQIWWRERLGLARRGSAKETLIHALPDVPPLTTIAASELIGRSFQATCQAIDRLVGAGILTQVTVGRRNRAFDVPELIEAFTALERQLASP